VSRAGIQHRHQLLIRFNRYKYYLLIIVDNTILPTLLTVFKRNKKRALSIVGEYPQIGVVHSEPPVKRNRLRSLESLCPRWVYIPTQKQEVSSTSEGGAAPSAVGQGSSLLIH